jgi:cytochrome c553
LKYFILIYFIFLVQIAQASDAITVPDTMAERVKACTICHGDEDKLGRDAYYPRIGGKPAGYLFNQLRNFRDGRRYYQPMAILLENMTDTYLLEIAEYFSALQLPYPPPEQINIQSDEVKLAERLVYDGDPLRDIPACSTCHGETLMGVEPFIPGLLGLPRAYITAQMGGWRNGGLMRGQVPDCMSEIAKRLTDEETNAIAKWLAMQQASGKPSPSNALLPELVQRCNSIVMNNGTSK